MTIIALQRAAAVTFKNLLGNALPFLNGIALKKKKKLFSVTPRSITNLWKCGGKA